MKAKEFIFDFLNLIFILMLVAFCILYFISGDNFTVFTSILQASVPVSFFGIIFLIKLKFNRTELEKRKSEDNTDLTLRLDFMDKMWSEAIVFLTPITVILIYYFSEGKTDFIIVFEASIIFLVMFFWQKFLFDKTEK
jgi:hypothetical protein